jgi:signal peptidase
MKKIINSIFFGVIIGFLVLTLGSQLFGYKYYSVISDSMYPSLPKHSLVYVKVLPNHDINNLKIGDIVAIKTSSEPLLHEVVKLDGDIITTHGENNEIGVNEENNFRDVIGVSKFHIPFIGLLFRSVYIWIVLGLGIIFYILIGKLLKEIKK